MDTESLLALWAKLPRGKDAAPSYHPLLCHMIDVALVAQTMWDEVLPPAARQRLGQALDVPVDVARAWVAFSAGLHDVGKASPKFARQCHRAVRHGTRISELLEAAGFSWPPDTAAAAPHGPISAVALREILIGPGLGLNGAVADRIATLVGGHHGIFPSAAALAALHSDAVGWGSWARARSALTAVLGDLFELPRELGPKRLDNTGAMVLAGLVSVADWIGSNTEFFPHAIPDVDAIPTIDPRAYARQVQPRAREALERLGWLGWAPRTEPASFPLLFPRTPEPNAVQRAVMTLTDELSGPSLVVIEAPMGVGKTEAALYLQDWWATRLGQRGAYVALPTQATSNQMFGRVQDFLGRRYSSDFVELHLLHGHAALSAEYETLRLQGDRLFVASGVEGDRGYDGASASVVASEWFTHRKRGLLAPFGVGTVDQALMAVLQTKHVFVRLFGLAHKTVVIDEVHAYDTYMTTLLERLLEWLGALGSSVALLSATLPRSRRDALAHAYARGLGRPDADSLASADTAYPRITWVGSSTAGSRQVDVRELGGRRVRMERLPSRLPEEGQPFELGERLRRVLEQGGCVAVICNTVARAQAVYRALKPYFPGQSDDGWPELDLLHARFLFGERDRREKRALARFGKPGAGVRRPFRAVLVATQVIEQSLDLDFDLMVTDLAPVDLVLQRAGRLHRHVRSRPPSLEMPTLWLLAPETDADGLPTFPGGFDRVYEPHVLLRSWLELRDRASLDLPGDIDPLVEAVYADDLTCPVEATPALRRRWDETGELLLRNRESDSAEARDRWLKRPHTSLPLWRFVQDPREEDEPDFHRAHQALTRLTDPSVPVVCLYDSSNGVSLDPGGRRPVNPRSAVGVRLAKQLLARSVPLTDKRIVFKLVEQDAPPAWQRSPLLRHHRLLVLNSSGSAVVGQHRVQLDVELGVVVGEQKGTEGD